MNKTVLDGNIFWQISAIKQSGWKIFISQKSKRQDWATTS